MLDRTQPPPFKSIDQLRFPWPQTLTLKPDIPLYLLDMGAQPLIKLECVFDAGAWQEPQNGVAYLTTKMLLEGTQRRSAAEVAQHIDQYGADLITRVHPDNWSITLVTLSQHLVPMLELLSELLLMPAFDEQRLAHRKHLKQQSLKVDAQKNDKIARKKFREVLFQAAHPYGKQLTAEAIEAVTVDQLRQFHRTKLFANGRIFLSGQVHDQHLQAIQHHLQGIPTHEVDNQSIVPAQGAVPTHAKLPAKGDLQAALHVGKVLFARTHPDYAAMFFVNALLGGYFGSRLMRNIREDKGYTYGIHARIIALKHTSYLHIATEVIRESLEATCIEIRREIETLQSVPVPQRELQTLRHYLLGTFLAHVSDPFSIMEKFKAAQLHGLGQGHYTQLLHTIRGIDEKQVMEMANRYLAVGQLSQVVVG